MTEKRVAFVTGGSRGIGAAIVRRLAKDGLHVVALARSLDKLQRVCSECAGDGGSAEPVACDITDYKALAGAIEQAGETHGRLDVLVNNAGIMVRAPMLAVPAAECRRMFDVNVTGTMLCSRHALPHMVDGKGGRIINLSSQLAQRPVAGGGFAAYAATKGAIESLTRVVAAEVGVHGITVNAIAPGGIDTDMSRDVMTPEYRARRLAELPLRRFGSVDDVAYCAVVLASDEAADLTGQILHPSGGRVSG